MYSWLSRSFQGSAFLRARVFATGIPGNIDFYRRTFALLKTDRPYNEQELLKQLAEGQEPALEAIYHHYWEWLFFTSYHLLKDKQACEDIVQDVFSRLWINRNKLTITLSLKSYLFASCRYAIYRVIRTENVRDDLFDNIDERMQYESGYGKLEQKELALFITTAIDALPPKCREVFKLSREEGLSYKEIARQLDISVKTVENHIGKALHDLRQSLGGLLTVEFLVWFLKK